MYALFFIIDITFSVGAGHRQVWFPYYYLLCPSHKNGHITPAYFVFISPAATFTEPNPDSHIVDAASLLRAVCQVPHSDVIIASSACKWETLTVLAVEVKQYSILKKKLNANCANKFHQWNLCRCW